MKNATYAHIEDAPRLLLDGVACSQPVLLLGPSGSGRTFALRTLASLLAEERIPHLFVDATAPEAVEAIDSAAAGTVLLFDDYDRAPPEVLRAIASHLLSGAAGVGTADEILFSTARGDRLSRLYEGAPELREALAEARTVRLRPAEHESIARILHCVSSERLDSVTVSTLQQLAWGRPGWALDALSLHRNGSVTSTPLPRVRRPYASDLLLPSLRHASEIAEAELEAVDIAAAVTLSEIGPRSRNSVLDIVGSAVHHRLQASGILIAAPDSPESFGVPELYAAAIRGSTDPELLSAARRRAASHLLAQEVFGIPLADREAVFCSRALSRHGDGQDREIDADPSLGEHHARFQQRFVADLISFGEGERARDLLLQLGPHGPGLSWLARARLASVLRGAHTGLQALMSAEPPRGNCDLPSPDPSVRFALLLLRSRLAAQAGIELEVHADIAPDDEQWNDAQLVARRWNDDRPLGPDAAALLRIARSHPVAEVALLAEQLLSLDAAVFGLRYRSLGGASVEQKISRLAIGASEAQRDALECAVIAQILIGFFSSASSGSSGRDHGGGEARPLELVDHLPGASRHRIWATHLRATRTALLCGDLDRAEFEWKNFSDRMPRFIPWRLHSMIARLQRMNDEQRTAPDALGGYSGQLLAYFAGRFDDVTPEVFADPVARLAELGLLPSGVDPSQLEGLPERRPIHAHLLALKEQNPFALMRAADALEAYGFWASAAHAMQEARRIFLRRRASGSVTTTDARIAALQAETARRVPWFDPGALLAAAPRERLTPRETETARLAAEGLSNREIAERMRCSVRTVESHLAQARAKLGIRRREELGARMHRLGARQSPAANLSSRTDAQAEERTRTGDRLQPRRR